TLTHLRRVLPVHRVPSLLEERNESQADSKSPCQPKPTGAGVEVAGPVVATTSSLGGRSSSRLPTPHTAKAARADARRPSCCVEVAGIEPASDGAEPGLLRVQSRSEEHTSELQSR